MAAPDSQMNTFPSPRVLAVMRMLALQTAALCVAVPLAAQQRPDSVKATALPTITVSAIRSITPLAAAPYASTSVSVERLRSAAGIGLADALQGIPGVLAQSRAGGVDNRITIRGFGARGAGDRSNAATMRGIRVMIDGIPETEPDGRTSLDLIDLGVMSGVDVIRSNASALWGNAAGGIISLSSTPAAGSSFDARTMAGSFGLRRALASASTGTGDSRLYAAVSRTDADGWRQNSASDRTLFSSGVLTPLGHRTRLAMRLSAARNNFGIPGPLTFANAVANPRGANATYNTRRERRENQVIRFGTSLDHAIGSGGVLSVMSYVTPKTLIRSERGTYRQFNRVHGGGSASLRESVGTHNLIVGADVQHQDGPARFWSLSATGSKCTTLQQDKNERATTSGVFAQDEWNASPRVMLSIGARLDGLRYGLVDRITPKLNATRRYTQVSPKLGATFRTGSAGMFYANFGAGVEAPAGNETDPAGTFGQDTVTGISPLLKPIRSQTYEIGTRQVVQATTPGVRALRYDIAVFNTEVQNELVPYRGGRFYFNAGKARRQGVELNGELEFEQGFSLRSTATVLKARYTEYTVDSVHYGKPGRLANYAGNPVVGVPRTMASAGVRWDAPSAPLRLDGEFQYTGNYSLNDANTVELPAARVFNATLSLRRAARVFNHVGLTGFVRVENLLDRRYMTSGFLNPDVVAGEFVAYEPGLPRAFIISLGLVRLP
jgi:iron complex outermembrane recepter protein